MKYRVWHKGKWKIARSFRPIKRGKNKGRIEIKIFKPSDPTELNPNPSPFKRIIVDRDDLREIETVELLDKVQQAVKFGNGITQADLFKKAEQGSLF